jgi:hypothetical protein
MPAALAELRIADFRETEAFPTAAGRESVAALASELIGQGDFLAFGMTEDVRAKLAIESLVMTNDLFAASDRIAKKLVDGAGHDRDRLRRPRLAKKMRYAGQVASVNRVCESGSRSD